MHVHHHKGPKSRLETLQKIDASLSNISSSRKNPCVTFAALRQQRIGAVDVAYLGSGIIQKSQTGGCSTMVAIIVVQLECSDELAADL